MDKTSLKPGSTIGIIGGGQLGRMLAMAAARFGYETIILEPQAGCPAAQVANRQIVAAYDDPKALAELAAASDVITYEFENVPVSAADKLAETALVLPPPAALEISQDRFTEKQFLNESGIETAPWRLVDDEETLIAALGALGGRGILKTRRLGYDGKGQVRLASSMKPRPATLLQPSTRRLRFSKASWNSSAKSPSSPRAIAAAMSPSSILRKTSTRMAFSPRPQCLPRSAYRRQKPRAQPPKNCCTRWTMSVCWGLNSSC